MIPLLIGAAAGYAAYKLYEDKREKNSREETFTRYLKEEEVPPDVIEKIRAKRRAHFSKESY